MRRILLAIALSLCGSSAHLAADSGDSSPPNLEVSIRFDKLQFEVGEPIPLTMEIVNRGDVEYSVLTSTEPTGALDGCGFIVSDFAGNPIARPATLSKPASWIGSWFGIKRHEKHERKMFLNYWFPPLPPGRYFAQTVYSPRVAVPDTPRQWPAIRSTKVEFNIVPTTSTKLDVRLTRLSQQAQQGDLLAVDFLGFTGEPGAIDPLLELCYSDDLRTQRRAANALSYLRDQPAVIDATVARFKERGPNSTLAEWLASSDAPAELLIPIYVEAMNSTEASVRVGAITGLRLYATAPQLPAKFQRVIRTAINRALTDKDARVRVEAVSAIETHPDADAVATLAALAREDPNPRVRNLAAAGLNDLRSDAVIPYARELLLREFRLRPNYAEQLREIGTPRARAVLHEGLKSVNPRVRTECAKQLWLLREHREAKPALAEALRTGDAELQADVASFLVDAIPAGTNNTPQAWVDWLEKR